MAFFEIMHCIFIHELGHFIAAKKRGLIADRFSIGFGKPLYTWRDSQGTEYAIAMIPLGGYVALPQIADMPAIEGADATAIVTEWDAFRALDLARVKDLAKAPVLVDLRNIYNPSETTKQRQMILSSSGILLKRQLILSFNHLISSNIE